MDVVRKSGWVPRVNEIVGIGEPRPKVTSDGVFGDMRRSCGCPPFGEVRSVANVVFFRRDLSAWVAVIRSWPVIGDGDLDRLSSRFPRVTPGPRTLAVLRGSSPLGRDFFKIGGGNDALGALADFLSAVLSIVLLSDAD